MAVLDLALTQIPAEDVESLEIFVRADSAGATHGLVDYCREADMRFSVGYELTEPVRAAILQIPADAWVPALDQDGSERENGEVAEITDSVDLSAWGEQDEPTRLIVRVSVRTPARHCHSPTTTATASSDPHRPDRPRHRVLECRHRQHAHVEDRIRDDKDTGLPVPVQGVRAQRGVVGGRDARARPARLDPALSSTGARQGRTQAVRYRLLHVAGRLAFSGRRRNSTSRTHGPGRPSSSPPSRSSNARRRHRLNSRHRPHTPPSRPLPATAAIEPAPRTPAAQAWQASQNRAPDHGRGRRRRAFTTPGPPHTGFSVTSPRLLPYR